ncbi:MAG: class I SAM-dependent methyltransferase [Desulfurivibrionaceae bacterium]
MNEIDYEKIARFWDKCPLLSKEAPSLITTLPFEIPGHAHYRDKTEKNLLFKCVAIGADASIADLGCGTGRWAIEFAKRCKRVFASDISGPLLEIANAEARRNAITNIEFRQEATAAFQPPEKMDIIHVGGVFSYMNDADVKKTIKRCSAMLKEGGLLVLRESVSLNEDILRTDTKIGNEEYTAFYRTPSHLASLLEEDFVLEKTLETHSYLFPVPVYLYLLPKFLKKTRGAGYLMKMLYEIQWRLDPVLLKIPALTKLKHWRLRKTDFPVTQCFFFYRKRRQNVHPE